MLDTFKRCCNMLLNGASRTSGRHAPPENWSSCSASRGGVGATTIAVNAAMRLADKGQRWVMLVDLDIEGGDAALQLAANPTNALHEALERPERVDKLFLERGALHASDRLDLLASLEPFGKSASAETKTVLVADRQALAALSFRVRRSADSARGEHRSGAACPERLRSGQQREPCFRARPGAVARMDRAEFSGAAHHACPEHERR